MLNNTGYRINTTTLSEKKLTKLKLDLTVKPTNTMDMDDSNTEFEVFRQHPDNIIQIPRYYGIRNVKSPDINFDVSKSAVDFEFKGVLRPNQLETATVALNMIREQGGGILQLHTGYGKTTIALYLASILKLKTLILVHKTFLQDQWYDRIKQFTNANIGMIRQQKIDIENKDIVIGMLQSVSMIDYDLAIFKDFQVLICDECHHLGSRVFSRALFKLCPKYTIGLSATPTRNDGLTKVIKWFMGDVLVKVERKGDNAVYIKAFEYTATDKLFEEKKRWFKGKTKPDTVKMITNMHKIPERNKFVAGIINSLRVIDERKILILSGRIDHLKELKKIVDDVIGDDIVNNRCYEGEYKTAYYIGGMKDYELKDSSEADVIFATYSMAEEGLDIDGLNTLILATPKKNIIQSIGRIMRKPIKKGDINPLVIDIIDNLSCFKSWGDKRIKYYETNKYTVNTYKAHNNQCVSFKDYLVQNKIIDQAKANDPNLDVRKEYIVHRHGIETYQFEFDSDFYSWPETMFNYDCDLGKIFEINHDYDTNDNAIDA